MNGTTTVSLVGVGGQGILLAAAILAETAMADGYDVKASEVKGMAQRGGSVLSTVRFGKQVWSPLARHADIVIATELLEGRRALLVLLARRARWSAPRTASLPAACCAARRSTRTTSRPPPPRAPSRSSWWTPRRLAREAGTVRAANVALLGAASVDAAVRPSRPGSAASRPPCRPRSSRSISAPSLSGARRIFTRRSEQ